MLDPSPFPSLDLVDWPCSNRITGQDGSISGQGLLYIKQKKTLKNCVDEFFFKTVLTNCKGQLPLSNEQRNIFPVWL